MIGFLFMEKINATSNYHDDEEDGDQHDEDDGHDGHDDDDEDNDDDDHDHHDDYHDGDDGDDDDDNDDDDDDDDVEFRYLLVRYMPHFPFMLCLLMEGLCYLQTHNRFDTRLYVIFNFIFVNFFVSYCKTFFLLNI